MAYFKKIFPLIFLFSYCKNSPNGVDPKTSVLNANSNVIEENSITESLIDKEQNPIHFLLVGDDESIVTISKDFSLNSTLNLVDPSDPELFDFKSEKGILLTNTFISILGQEEISSDDAASQNSLELTRNIPRPNAGDTIHPVYKADNPALVEKKFQNPTPELTLIKKKKLSIIAKIVPTQIRSVVIKTFQALVLFLKEDIIPTLINWIKDRKISKENTGARTYFEDAVIKKRIDVGKNEYSEFNIIPKLSDGGEVKLKDGTTVTKIPSSVLEDKIDLSKLSKSTGDGRMVLGMLPEPGTIAKVRKQFAASGQDISITSILRDFEMNKVKSDFKKSSEITTQAIPENPKAKNILGVSDIGGSWMQFHSKDRRMLNQDALSGAVQHTMTRLKAGDIVYVHCKSGKGRSATVVTAVNGRMVLDSLKGGETVSKKEIDKLIEEQINITQAARSEIGISLAQQTALQIYLYNYARTVGKLAE